LYVDFRSAQLTEVGYLRIGVAEAFEHMNMNMKEMKRSTATQQITIRVLFNLSQAVKRLFSQMISVGSEASSILRGSPRSVLMSAYVGSVLTTSSVNCFEGIRI
jgi:hypothetical protein